ncbi:hypothetical protein B9Q02_09665, partial [Candidatus Marsarchaeota G1 archaeon BE_D]
IGGVVYALASYPPYFVNLSVQLVSVNTMQNVYSYTLVYHYVVNDERITPLLSVTAIPSSKVLLQNGKILIFSSSQNVNLTIEIASGLVINCLLKA